MRTDDAGVASATVNSTFHIGGSIGLAVFTVIYANTATDALAGGSDDLAAFTDGYTAAFLAAGIAMVVAAAIGFFLIRGTKDDLMPAWDSDDAEAYAHR